jgi:hypothetical protein
MLRTFAIQALWFQGGLVHDSVGSEQDLQAVGHLETHREHREGQDRGSCLLLTVALEAVLVTGSSQEEESVSSLRRRPQLPPI